MGIIIHFFLENAIPKTKKLKDNLKGLQKNPLQRARNGDDSMNLADDDGNPAKMHDFVHGYAGRTARYKTGIFAASNVAQIYTAFAEEILHWQDFP